MLCARQEASKEARVTMSSALERCDIRWRTTAPGFETSPRRCVCHKPGLGKGETPKTHTERVRAA